MNMKKIAILALSLCMIAAVAVTGTIAYFTDYDADHNVFTVGNVDIEQQEDYDPETPLIPTVPMKKDIFVENEGNTPVYYRTILAFEDTRGLTRISDENSETGYRDIITVEGSDYELVWTELRFDVEGDPEGPGLNETYRIAYILSTEELGVEEKEHLMATITVGPEANNAWQYFAKRSDGRYNLIVLTQATQTDGFENAEDALNTTFGPIDDDTDINDLITLFNQAEDGLNAVPFEGYNGPEWYQMEELEANGVAGNNEAWDQDHYWDEEGNEIGDEDGADEKDPLFYDYITLDFPA